MHAKGTENTESGHHKEFFYWAKLMAHYEWPALAGLFAAFFLAVPRSLLAGCELVVIGVGMLCSDIIENSRLAELLKQSDYLPPNLGLTNLGSFGAFAAVSGVGFFLALPARDKR